MMSLIAIFCVQFFINETQKMQVVCSGIIGIAAYLFVKKICAILEDVNEKKMQNSIKNAATGGFMMFLYLELIDASFSLDGVLGSFAISKDIIIIMTGLAIGAMFVRSLTLVMVEKKTLKKYPYLSSGAHYAILTLAIIMFISTVYEVPEIITGTLGLLFVGASFIASLKENKNV